MNLAAYRQSAQEQERIRSLLALVPPGLASVLDIGARDCYISRLLADRFPAVTALDLERPVCEMENVTPVEGDVTKLPFPDNAFDVVLCAEVLEHISPGQLGRACAEIRRVARSYAVIGVPYKQDTRVGRTTCRSCGRTNPPWGHVNTFDEARLQTLFAPCTPVSIAFAGVNRDRTSPVAALLLDLAGNPWGTYDRDERCVHCGAALDAPVFRSFPQRAMARIAWLLNRWQIRLVCPTPNWIHVLFRKECG